MLFNSLEFLIFLPIVLIAYWTLAKYLSCQNLLILFASYLFYGWWSPWFLLLIVASSACDFIVARSIDQTEKQSLRRLLLGVSICFNLGLLFYFKYCNFFIESAQTALESIGLQPNLHSLNVILPVGISFYTFQTLSYTIDVYRRRLKPTKDPLAFFAFVSFFPQLVAGPIERASNLLPQFLQARRITSRLAVLGIYQIIWGFFKKMVIADNCAIYANQIFDDPSSYGGWSLLLGAIYFAFQIYGDFSGYSDIAIGTGKLFGFTLMVNFRYPYFSRDIAEFWRSWHISLSTWFRDYVYIPLGGSRGVLTQQIRNVLIVFVVSGFWHGANWTYIAWGFLNGLYFLPLLVRKMNRKNLEIVASDSMLPSVRDCLGITLTFTLTLLAWVFFRAESIGAAFSYLGGMMDLSSPTSAIGQTQALWLIGVMLVLEWFSRTKEQPLQFANPFRLANVAIVSLVFWMTIVWSQSSEKEFIYFQF